MEDFKLVELEKLKMKLVKEITVLESELKEQQNIEYQQSSVSSPHCTLDPILRKGNYAFTSKYSQQQKDKLCEFSHYITGITFENVNKDWLHNKTYKYTANVVTKAIHFYLELTVDLKNESDVEVLDITCHFVDIKQCFMLEITPWVQLLAKMKNFSLFMSAISDYNEYNILRNKILDNLQADNYVRYDYCGKDSGGILVNVISPSNINHVYLKFQWSMKFYEQTCHMEHYFTIDATEFGMEFVETNVSLLKKFCKLNLQKKDLVELWKELCNAIDTYEKKST